jgi:hypothetical protein
VASFIRKSTDICRKIILLSPHHRGMIEDTVTVIADAKNEVEQHQVANTQVSH